MKVKDYMTKDPICIELPNTRREALRMLVKNNITGMPVIKEDGTLAGVVTRQNIFDNPNETQLAMIMDWEVPTIGPNDGVEKAAKLLYGEWIHRLMVTENNKLVGLIAPADLLPAVNEMNLDDSIENYIFTTTVPIFEDTPLPTAAAIIRLSKTYALPVLDKNGFLVGIVTDRDLFNMSTIDDSIALTELGLGDDEDAWSWEGLRNIMKLYYEVSKIELPSIPVKEIMIKEPRTLFAGTPIAKAARVMKKYDFGQLPVRNTDDMLMGMVYDVDLIASLIKSKK